MSAQNSAGIQTLLDAEREASKIVQKGMLKIGTVRTKRVKEARDEAKKEIEAYRNSKEDEFKKFESEHSQGNKAAEDEANKEAEGKIKEIQGAGKKSQDKVVADLLKAVFEVKPVAPTAA
ncbi:V-type ATPase [Colletotrichum orchidophilum]|uniref:V-type proton ATPase subunit G n=1 Tax=Colletotrichum orchidophilum TaxID=1209926 RepID=A0A1G4AYM1_9PEZI|nr:V-type ATPase [Colletotrichum orchidophilum]OHE94231.1 V-type ATPase [Colletotrichum orchidophilum]